MESKELLKFLGLPEEMADKTIDDIKEPFQKKYIGRDYVIEDDEIKGKIAGKLFNISESKLLKLAGKEPAFAIGEDGKKKKFENLLDDVFTDIETQKKELETKFSSSADDRVKQAETLAEKYKSENMSYKDRMKELEEKAQKAEQEKEQSVNTILMKYKTSEIKSKVPLIDNMTSLQRSGLEAEMGKYQLDWDEKKENILPKLDGKLIPSKKHGGFADYAEIFEHEAEQGGVLKKNNAQPRQRSTIPIIENQVEKPQVKRKVPLTQRQIISE